MSQIEDLSYRETVGAAREVAYKLYGFVRRKNQGQTGS